MKAVMLNECMDILVLENNSHVFCSPECILSSAKWRKAMVVDSFGEQLVAICIDEAHYIVKW